MEDVRWLGFDWEDRLFYASDYFDQLYEWAVQLIKSGKAYVCDLTADEIREYRGTLTEPGKESPYRNRSVEENLDLFERMRAGEFPDGSRTLRAKIDMASPNLNMRDPVMYRILHAEHHRTGDKWCIYPMYDYAHGQSDSIEGITHSICTLEFEDHRPLYDWYLEQLGIYHPQQIEFARLNLTYTVLSKRKLLHAGAGRAASAAGTIRACRPSPACAGAATRRRPSALSASASACPRPTASIEIGLLEHAVREDLNKRAPRVMAVLRPLQGGHRQLPGGPGRRDGGGQQPGRRRAWARARCRSPACCTSSRTISAKTRPSSTYRLAPGPRSAAALCLLHHVHGRGEG